MRDREIFKDVKGYEGLYQVSNLGRVKSLERENTDTIGRTQKTKEKILIPVSFCAYYGVNLYKSNEKKTKAIHQLVAVAFLDHVVNGMNLVVNHVDLNKLNNNVNNLEIVTQRENTNRKHIKSSSKYAGVSWYKRDSKWKAQIQIKGKRKHLGYFDNELEASNAYQKALKES